MQAASVLKSFEVTAYDNKLAEILAPDTQDVAAQLIAEYREQISIGTACSVLEFLLVERNAGAAEDKVFADVVLRLKELRADQESRHRVLFPPKPEPPRVLDRRVAT